jgi:Alpha-galactosidase
MRKLLLVVVVGFAGGFISVQAQQAAEVQAPQPPLMGWASWNHFKIDISESIIKGQADAMVKTGLSKLGYTYINIDDGFWGGRDAEGKIMYNKKRFPNGMKVVADYIHAKGLKAGIYSDAGINTCGSYWNKDSLGLGMGLYGHDEEDLVRFLKEWDYDFLKVDWCGGQWLGLDEQKRYTDIGLLAKKLKPSMYYNVCRWAFPGKWVTEVADSWRVSGDIDNTFESVLKIIDLNADLWMYSSRGHYNDMDMLQVGRGMSYDEDKTHFSMWCMMQSPLLLGNDLTNMSNQTLEIISNPDLIALDQSSFVYQARRVAKSGDLEVWARPLVSTMSGTVAVALLNRSKETKNITCSMDSVGINATKGYTVKDLWTKEKCSTAKAEEIVKQVPPHGIVVLRIEGEALPFNVFQYKDKK